MRVVESDSGRRIVVVVVVVGWCYVEGVEGCERRRWSGAERLVGLLLQEGTPAAWEHVVGLSSARAG